MWAGAVEYICWDTARTHITQNLRSNQQKLLMSTTAIGEHIYLVAYFRNLRIFLF